MWISTTGRPEDRRPSLNKSPNPWDGVVGGGIPPSVLLNTLVKKSNCDFSIEEDYFKGNNRY